MKFAPAALKDKGLEARAGTLRQFASTEKFSMTGIQ
jgi:hypothetical protein